MAEADIVVDRPHLNGANLNDIVPKDAMSRDEGIAAIPGVYKITGVEEPVTLSVSGYDVTSAEKPFGNKPFSALIEKDCDRCGLHIAMGGFPMKGWVTTAGGKTVIRM